MLFSARLVQVDVLAGFERGEGRPRGVFEGRLDDDHADGRVGEDLGFRQVFQAGEGFRLLRAGLAGGDGLGEADDVVKVGQGAERVHLARGVGVRCADLGDAEAFLVFGGEQAGERGQGEAGEEGATVDHRRSQVAAAVFASVPSTCGVAAGKSEASGSPATQSGWAEARQRRPGTSRYLAPPGRNIGSR